MPENAIRMVQVKQYHIKMGPSPDFALTKGQISINHRIRIQISYRDSSMNRIISMTDRSFHKLLDNLRLVIFANLKIKTFQPGTETPRLGFAILKTDHTTIQVTYSFPIELQPADKRKLHLHFIRNFNPIF
jgi:hypothetical protein